MEQKQRILVVDDNEENLSVIGNSLLNEGYVVQFAENGEIALTVVKKKLPELILLDISMPGLSGFEVCKILKTDSTTKEIPIIFLTAHNSTEDIINGFSMGAIDYITKPFNAAELLSRVHTHIELKQAKEQLIDQNSELKKLNTTKNKLFSILAHDLKNPFNALINMNELVSSKIEENDITSAKTILNHIQKTSEQALTLLENLLNWSRLQTGRLEFSPSEFIFNKMLDNILELFESNCAEKNISIKKTIEPHLKINADKLMLETVLRNLISNAIKFTHRGGLINIVALKLENEIQVSVQDNGIGIPKNKIDNLFNIETNFSTTGTNNEKGTGLGLVLCKEFIEIHKGKLWAESLENEWTKFTFRIEQ